MIVVNCSRMRRNCWQYNDGDKQRSQINKISSFIVVNRAVPLWGKRESCETGCVSLCTCVWERLWVEFGAVHSSIWFERLISPSPPPLRLCVVSVNVAPLLWHTKYLLQINNLFMLWGMMMRSDFVLSLSGQYAHVKISHLSPLSSVGNSSSYKNSQR